LILAGTTLLIWVFKENTPLEWWLRHGPFSKLDDPNRRVITNEEGKSLLIGPAGSALQLDNQNRISKVISAPHGMFHKTRDGQVVALVDGQAQPIGQMDGPIDPGFISQFNTPHHEQRFNGHNPDTDPEDQYGWWYEHPQSAAKALADAIFSPKVTLNHRRAARADVPDILEIRIDLASFIDGKSLLFAELWRTERDGTLKDKPGEDKVRLCTGEGSGPKTVRVEWPIIWSDVNEGIEHICVRVSLDLHGDGSLWLPLPAGETGKAIEEEGPKKDDLECVAHEWVEERDVLHMHRGKWEMIQTEKRRAALQAEQERYEARRKQEKGDTRD
jgi:hypothetical protein